MMVLDGKSSLARQVVNDALNFLQQWCLTRSLLQRPCLPRAIVADDRWNKPPFNVLKCNVDAAVFQSLGLVGSGSVISIENSIEFNCILQRNRVHRVNIYIHL